MLGANSFTVNTTTEGSARWASHVWECLRTAVRASHSLHGRRLPISATRMRISTRGLVLRQCHNSFLYFVQSIELKRSVYYSKRRTIAQPNFYLVRQKLYKRAQFMPLFSEKTTFSLHYCKVSVGNQLKNGRNFTSARSLCRFPAQKRQFLYTAVKFRSK